MKKFALPITIFLVTAIYLLVLGISWRSFPAWAEQPGGVWALVAQATPAFLGVVATVFTLFKSIKESMGGTKTPPPANEGMQVTGNIKQTSHGSGANVAAGKIEGEGHQFGGERIEHQEIHHHHPAYEPGKPPLQLPSRAERFTGRVEDLATVTTALQPGSVYTIAAPGGMGKSALAAEAVHHLHASGELARRFPDGVLLHTFYSQPQAAQCLDHIARSYGIIPEGDPRPAAQRALGGKTALLILDGAEAADDLPAVLDARGQCGILITTRDRRDAPAARLDLRPLSGGDDLDLLRKWVGEPGSDPVLAEICNLLGGLPLAIHLAGRYMAEQDEPAARYRDWLQSAGLGALDFGARQRDSVPLLLERSLEQVSPAAKDVLALAGRLALQPFDLEILPRALGVTPEDLRRLLAQLVRYGFLLAEAGRWQVSHALLYAFARRLPLPEGAPARLGMVYAEFCEAMTAKKVEGFAALDAHRPHVIAALEELMAAGHWDEADALCWAVEDYLDLQGFFTERISVIQTGIEASRKRGDRRNEGNWLGNLGIAYADLGEAAKAIGYYEQALDISREIGDRRGEGAHLGNLGNAYANLGEAAKAIGYYEQALDISREIGDRRGEGNHLGNLGNAYLSLGEAAKAIGYYKQALVISREIGDRRGEGAHLGNLGNAYRNLGEAAKAIGYYEQALDISREIGDRRGEGNRLGSLGNAYADLGEAAKAIGYYEQALDISREIGDRRNEGNHLGNLGNAYLSLGEAAKAIGYYEQALDISREIGDRRGEGNRLGNLGNAYADLGEAAKAIGYYEQALDISREIGDRRGEGNHLANMGMAQKTLGDTGKARELWLQALAIFEQIQSPSAATVRGWLDGLARNG
jgi:tetratricopeptide (TPR) repeat protein